MTSPITRRTVAAGLGAALAAPALAQGTAAYPNRPIRLVYPYAPGGSTDVLARAMAERLRESLGQPVVVDNRPGANTMLAAGIVARSAPDGYTVGWIPLPAVTTAFHFFPDPGYRIEDFQPVTLLIRAPNVFAVGAHVPARTLGEFTALARSAPAPLTYATNGLGGSSQLVAEMYQGGAGIRLQVVSYRGEAPAFADIIGGRVDGFCGSVPGATPHHRAGTMRTLAVSSAERLPDLPDVPTFGEAGIPDLVYLWWHGIAVRAGTPRPIVDRLNAAIGAVLREPDLAPQLGPGTRPSPTTPEEFASVIAADHARLGELIRARGITAE